MLLWSIILGWLVTITGKCNKVKMALSGLLDEGKTTGMIEINSSTNYC